MSGTVVESAVHVEGWAASPLSGGGTGVDVVDLWLDGPRGAGTWLGRAEYGLPRPDVAERLANAETVASGFSFELDASALEPGRHELYAYARGVDGGWGAANTRFTVIP